MAVAFVFYGGRRRLDGGKPKQASGNLRRFVQADFGLGADLILDLKSAGL